MATSPPSSGPILTSLSYYDDLRANATRIDRPEGSNLDLLHFSDENQQPAREPLALCHLHLIAYLDQTGRSENIMASALAVQHLNDGNGGLVGDVSRLLPLQCPNLKFTLELTNIGATTGSSLENVIELTDRQSKRPCAFVGAFRSFNSIPTSMITGIRGYPQISGSASSKTLDDRSSHPLFARTVASDFQNAPPILQFLREDLGVGHLAVLHLNEPYGNAYAEGLRETVKKQYPDFSLVTVSMPYPFNDKEDIAEAIRSLKLTRFRYFFGIVITGFDDILEEAWRQGIAGNPDHTWIFSDGFAPSVVLSRPFPRNSILHQVYNGIGYFGFSAGRTFRNHDDGDDDGDDFAWQMSQLANQQDMDYMSKQIGFNPLEELGKDVFLNPLLDPYVAFYYDATIALGLSACQSIMTTSGINNNQQQSSPVLNGTFHYENLLQLDFDGVTGNVQFDPATGSRTSTFYDIFNIVEDQENSNASHVQFKQVLTNVYKDGEWHHLADYMFSSGTSDIPLDLPPFELNQNYLSLGTRIVTLSLCFIAVVLAMGFALWTWIHRDARVVKASQPFFLYIICVGALILATSIIPGVIDPSWASMQGCHIACNSIGWLVTLGFSLIFSALFTKTYRANKIINNPKRFKRITLTVKDVLGPMLVLVGLNILLLSLMTALAPQEWKINVVSTDSLRDVPSETYGRCSLESEQLPYLVTLFLINLGTLLFAIQQAWVARRISTEFAESLYIFRALATIFLVIFSCGPVVFLAKENPNASVFVGCVMIFVTSTSSLLWIFVPKIHFYRKDQLKKSKPSIKVSGIEESPPVMGHWAQQQQSTIDWDDGTGERIITRKSTTTLVREIMILEHELESFRHPPTSNPTAVENQEEERENLVE